MASEKKYDPLTGEEFIPGRSNQRFATRANAIKYNNMKAKERRDAMRYIQDPIQHNLNFLAKKLAGKRDEQFTIEYLRGAEYNINVMTHFRTVNKVQYPCLYNYMMIKVDEKNIKFERYD